ncbi:MAG TPA: hypothetical protein VKG92_06035 [Flavobacteriales bacterium]|nr:hypothetical protein [Flavobacteriales bacterium]
MEPLRKVLSDATELIVLANGRLVHPERGNVALLYRLHRIYDQPNVIAVDLLLGEREITDIRKMDRTLERRLQGLLKGLEQGNGEHKVYLLRVRFTAVIG